MIYLSMEQIINMKVCTECKQGFPATTDYFNKQSDKKSKLSAWCKSCRSIKMKIYYQNNSEKINKRNKNYQKNNSKKVKERTKRYKKNNPEVARRSSRKRRALILNNTHEYYTEKQVLEKYGNNCYICNISIDLNAPRSSIKNGWQYGLHIEHVIDIALGGPDTLENARPSHGICNLKKKPVGMV